jgi:hypothetical protein
VFRQQLQQVRDISSREQMTTNGAEDPMVAGFDAARRID